MAGDPIWIGVVAHVFHFITFVAFMGWRAFKGEMKLHPFDCEFVTLVMYRKNNIFRKLGGASLMEDLEMLEVGFALFIDALISTWCM